MFDVYYNVKLFNCTTDEIDVDFVFRTKEEAEIIYNNIHCRLNDQYGQRYHGYYNLSIEKFPVITDVEYAKYMLDDALVFDSAE